MLGEDKIGEGDGGGDHGLTVIRKYNDLFAEIERTTDLEK